VEAVLTRAKLLRDELEATDVQVNLVLANNRNRWVD
jgi:small nuclear ribonucleoprotein (snRNP)-like protein